MRPDNEFAFKEWAVVCEALGQGRQSVILRKGGIHEGRDGFRVDHGEFWLFPTRFHQDPDELAPEAQPLWESLQSQPPPSEVISFKRYVVVEEVRLLEDEQLLPRLAGLHVWSERVLSERFQYRKPGLFVLLVRTFQLPTPWEVPDSPHFAGCRSWVDLPRSLSTEGLVPVLDDDTAQAQLDQIRRALNPVDIT